MATSTGLVAIVAFTVLAGLTARWLARRLTSVALLKDATVSRRWLLDHQDEA